MLSDIQIAQQTELKPIYEIAKTAGIDEKYLEPYGRSKAKIDLSLLKENKNPEAHQRLFWSSQECLDRSKEYIREGTYLRIS